MGRYINKKTNSGALGYRAVRRSRPAGATCDQPRVTPWVYRKRSAFFIFCRMMDC